MVKAIHLYASAAQFNSGDFFLGPATKHKFEQMLSEPVEWTSEDIRNHMTRDKIKYFNSFDYIVVGGGGLILPDTNPNLNSGWQWNIPTELLEQVKKPIYVMSIGYNLFYNQDMTMPNRDGDFSDPERIDIFKKSITTLLDKSSHFSMRHNGDIDNLINIIGEEYRDKIKFEFCPVIEYVNTKYSINVPGEYHAFEIKDDRPNRRYAGTSQPRVYGYLLEYIKHLQETKAGKIAVMSHDGSNSFAAFLKKNGVAFRLLNNTVANEEQIIDNYRHVKKLYCTAGHSQMTAHALGIDYFTLISHPKVEHFLRDTDRFYLNNFSYIKDENLLFNLKRGLYA